MGVESNKIEQDTIQSNRFSAAQRTMFWSILVVTTISVALIGYVVIHRSANHVIPVADPTIKTTSSTVTLRSTTIETAPTNNLTAAFKKYTSSEHGFSFDYPSKYQFVVVADKLAAGENDEMIALSEKDSQFDVGCSGAYTISHLPVPAGGSYDRTVKNAQLGLFNEKTTELTIAGRPAVFVTGTFSPNALSDIPNAAVARYVVDMSSTAVLKAEACQTSQETGTANELTTIMQSLTFMK